MQSQIETLVNEIVQNYGYGGLYEDSKEVLGSWVHGESSSLDFLEDVYLFLFIHGPSFFRSPSGSCATILLGLTLFPVP